MPGASTKLNCDKCDGSTHRDQMKPCGRTGKVCNDECIDMAIEEMDGVGECPECGDEVWKNDITSSGNHYRGKGNDNRLIDTRNADPFAERLEWQSEDSFNTNQRSRSPLMFGFANPDSLTHSMERPASRSPSVHSEPVFDPYDDRAPPYLQTRPSSAYGFPSAQTSQSPPQRPQRYNTPPKIRSKVAEATPKDPDAWIEVVDFNAPPFRPKKFVNASGKPEQVYHFPDYSEQPLDPSLGRDQASFPHDEGIAVESDTGTKRKADPLTSHHGSPPKRRE